MASFHKDRKIAAIKDLAAKFFGENSNRTSLITVTDLIPSTDGKSATIYVTVLPESHEIQALDFARRHLGDLRQYIGNEARLGVVPFLSIEIDGGEKNRQRIDELLREDSEKQK